MATNFLTNLIPTSAPRLPSAPPQYDGRFQEQYSNILRLYFNQLDNINSLVAKRIVPTGIEYPDGTIQTTAYIAGSIEVYDRSATITVNSTPTLLTPANFINANNVAYNSSTGVFTFAYAGSFSLALNLNANASASGQTLYVYAESNTGSGWSVIPNSGKAYQLPNSQHTQIMYANSVVRTVGQQIRYWIYSNDSKVTLVTDTMPGVTPTVYVPAIRIQYAS
jgi:hypothetical protein